LENEMMSRPSVFLSKAPNLVLSFIRWFDAWAGVDKLQENDPQRVDWSRVVPFIGVHLMCLGVFWVGWSWTAVSVAAALYAIRMFAITGFYHRYFSHRSFKTGRWCQLAFAILGASAVQRGPLWWAAHHRNHHRHSDQESDVHSPCRHGLIWSHMGWITSRPNFVTRLKAVPDLVEFPELRFLDRFDILVPTLLGVALYYLGVLLATVAPELGTNGPQMLIWGFFISTIVLFHCTNTVNSLAHRIGTQRYDTQDKSRNNLFLALITFGEGWHNNHHHYPSSARQGFYWWEIDLTYYGLVLLSWLGLIWDLRPVPVHVRDAGRIDKRTAA
jgi:stearoyl-CoA desaturase (delta-9 desaturase)